MREKDFHAPTTEVQLYCKKEYLANLLQAFKHKHLDVSSFSFFPTPLSLSSLLSSLSHFTEVWLDFSIIYMTDLLQVFKLKHIDSLSLSHQSLSCSFLVMFLLRYEDHLSLSFSPVS